MILAYPSWAPPPDPPTTRGFADTMIVPDGPYKGDQYNPDAEAAQSIICDVLDGKILAYDGAAFKDILTAQCTQAGKSLSCILLPALHTTIGCGESCVYCLPTGDLLNKVWIDKLKPSIEGTGYKDWIPDKGPGSRGGRPTSLPLIDPDTGDRAGSIIFVAGGSGNKKEAGQAGVTAKVVVLDEVDEYQDAHRIALVEQRAAAFGDDAIKIKCSTVKKDQNSVILILILNSTNSHIEYACPHCGRYQQLLWDQIRYEGDNDIDVADSVRYMCKHCDEAITEPERKVMLSKYLLVHDGQTVNENGEIVGPIPKSRTFGLTCNKLEFSIGIGMPGLAIEHFKATQMIEQSRDHGLMRSFYRDRLSLEYTLDRDELPEILTNKYLSIKSSRSKWFKRSVPSWAEQVFVGVDVQHDRVYWMAIAVTGGMRWAPIDWGYEYGDNERKQTATKEMRHQQLDIVRDYVRAGWGKVGDGEIIVPTFAAVDVGYATDDVTEWINNQARGWIAVRGFGEGEDEKGAKYGKKSEDLPGWGELRFIDKRRENWLYCNSLGVVRWMHDSLMRKPGIDGSGEIPKDSTGDPLKPSNAMLIHFTQNVYDFDQEKGKWYWRRIHAGRRDWRDTAKYALTLAKFKLHEDAKRLKAARTKAKRGRGIKQVGNIRGK